MNYPKPKKYYLLTRYFKYCDKEPELQEHFLSHAWVTKDCIDDWKKLFGTWTDFTYNLSVVTIEYECYITKTIYTYEQLLEDCKAEELEKQKRTQKINEDLARLNQNL